MKLVKNFEVTKIRISILKTNRIGLDVFAAIFILIELINYNTYI